MNLMYFEHKKWKIWAISYRMSYTASFCDKNWWKCVCTKLTQQKTMIFQKKLTAFIPSVFLSYLWTLVCTELFHNFVFWRGKKKRIGQNTGPSPNAMTFFLAALKTLTAWFFPTVKLPPSPGVMNFFGGHQNPESDAHALLSICEIWQCWHS